MRHDGAPSLATSRVLRIALAATALAFALHTCVGRWSLVATNVLVPLGVAMWLVLYFWGWGAIVGGLKPFRPADRELDPLCTIVLGVCASILAILLLGFAGLLWPAALIVLSAVVVAIGSWKRPPWRARSSAMCDDACASPRSARIRAVLLTLIGAWIAFALVLAFIPERSWDALAYHLAMGKIYVREARIVSIPWMFHSNFPIAADLVFLHGLVLGSEQSCLLLALFFALLAAAAVHRLARLFLAPNASLVVVLAFLLSPDVAESVDASLVEIAWSAFAVLGLACAVQSARGPREPKHATREPREPEHAAHGPRECRHLVHLAAVFAGFAAGTKFPGFLSAAAIGIVVLCAAGWTSVASSDDGATPRRSRFALASGVRFAWVCALAAAPCYVKSWIHTGTPLWPLSLGIFHVRNWSDDAQARFLDFSRSEWAPLSVAPLEAKASVLRDLLADRDEVTLVLCALWLAASLVFAFDARGRRVLRETAPLAVFILLHVAFWCAVSQQSRFLLPALPALVAAILCFVRAPLADTSFATRASTAVLAMALILAPLPAWIPKVTMLVRSGLPIVRGMSERTDALAPNPLFRLCTAANEITPPDARILLFQELRGYWLDRDTMWGDPINQAVIDYGAIGDARALRERLTELGITHVLLGPYTQEGRHADARATSMMVELCATGRRIAAEQGFALYAL